MTKEQLEYFKKKLLKLKSSILNGGVLSNTEDLHTSTDDLSDEADLANNVVSQQVSFNIRDRELAKVRQIDLALERIEDGTYGCCDDCNEEISQKRLENQPWTDLCIVHAEEREREQQKFVSNSNRY